MGRRVLTAPALMIGGCARAPLAVLLGLCRRLRAELRAFAGRHLAAALRAVAGARRNSQRVATLAAELRLFVPLLLRRARTLQPTRLPRQRREIVMLVVSELWRDPRVEREARALAEAGYRVKLIYPDFFSNARGVGPLDWGPNITFRPLASEHHHFIYDFPWLFGAGILKAALQERPFAFHSHDLTVSLIGLAAANATGAYCVCDFHEWYSENVSWNARAKAWVPHPRVKRWTYKLAEWWLMRRATALVTVCESIAQDLQHEFRAPRRKLAVIRNIPNLAEARRTRHRGLRQELGISSERFIVLWQGGVGPSRLLEPVIDAMEYVRRGVLVIRGPAIEEFGEAYMKRAADRGCAERVLCVPPVASSEVVAAAVGADAGIWTLPKLCKNFYYALPNKIFEYLAAGVPILCADYPEARRIAIGYDVGLCFDPYDPRSIAKQIDRMIDEPELSRRFRANTARALADMEAAREWSKLVEVYDGHAAGRSVEGDWGA